MLFKEFSIQRRNFLLIFFLILNSVAWFYLIVYKGFLATNPIPFAPSLAWLFYLAVLVSMLIGPIVAKRVKKMHFLLIWTILGIISSVFPLISPTLGELEVAILLVFWGVAFGVGFPSCLAMIPSLTKVGERGKTGGIIFCSTFVVIFLLFLVVKDLDISSYSLILGAWRSFGLVAFLFHATPDESLQPKPVSYFSVIRNKTFLLYFFPWLAFCIVNYFETPILKEFYGESFWVLIGAAEFTVGALSCLIGGWLMDLRGRKFVIIFGLVMFGLGFALLTIFPHASFALAFFVIASGTAFGIFTVAFIFVVWGDMLNGERGEKFYALGNSPIPAATMLSYFFFPWLVKLSISVVFSLASLFIFLAIILIFFAPELLPESVLKKRELERYAEKVKKIAERS